MCLPLSNVIFLDHRVLLRSIQLGADTDPAPVHRIHKWRTRRKKRRLDYQPLFGKMRIKDRTRETAEIEPRKSEALKDKQKLQMKTFSELAECLALIPLKITLYGRLFKYNYVGCLELLMFSTDLLFSIKRDAYIFKETG